MKPSLFLFSAALLLPCFAEAKTVGGGYIDAASGYTVTSDSTELFELEGAYRNHRRNLFWPFESENQSRWDNGAEAKIFLGSTVDGGFSGARANGMLAYRTSVRTIWEFRLGAAGQNVKINGKARATPVAQVDLFWRPVNWLDVHALAGHDFVYNEFLQPGAIEMGLRGYTVAADGHLRILNRLRFAYRMSHKILSDQNTRTLGDFALLYGISPGVPWIWGGVGYEWMGTGQNTISYWSPRRFWSFGPRIEGDIPIFDELSVFFGLNVNRFQEEDFPMGTGYYGVLGLRYGAREDVNYTLGYTRIRSAQNSGTWNSDGIAALVHVPL